MSPAQQPGARFLPVTLQVPIFRAREPVLEAELARIASARGEWVALGVEETARHEEAERHLVDAVGAERASGIFSTIPTRTPTYDPGYRVRGYAPDLPYYVHTEALPPNAPGYLFYTMDEGAWARFSEMAARHPECPDFTGELFEWTVGVLDMMFPARWHSLPTDPVSVATVYELLPALLSVQGGPLKALRPLIPDYTRVVRELSDGAGAAEKMARLMTLPLFTEVYHFFVARRGAAPLNPHLRDMATRTRRAVAFRDSSDTRKLPISKLRGIKNPVLCFQLISEFLLLREIMTTDLMRMQYAGLEQAMDRFFAASEGAGRTSGLWGEVRLARAGAGQGAGQGAGSAPGGAFGGGAVGAAGASPGALSGTLSGTVSGIPAGAAASSLVPSPGGVVSGVPGAGATILPPGAPAAPRASPPGAPATLTASAVPRTAGLTATVVTQATPAAPAVQPPASPLSLQSSLSELVSPYLSALSRQSLQLSGRGFPGIPGVSGLPGLPGAAGTPSFSKSQSGAPEAEAAFPLAPGPWGQRIISAQDGAGLSGAAGPAGPAGAGLPGTASPATALPLTIVSNTLLSGGSPLGARPPGTAPPGSAQSITALSGQPPPGQPLPVPPLPGPSPQGPSISVATGASGAPGEPPEPLSAPPASSSAPAPPGPSALPALSFAGGAVACPEATWTQQTLSPIAHDHEGIYTVQPYMTAADFNAAREILRAYKPPYVPRASGDGHEGPLASRQQLAAQTAGEAPATLQELFSDLVFSHSGRKVSLAHFRRRAAEDSESGSEGPPWRDSGPAGSSPRLQREVSVVVGAPPYGGSPGGPPGGGSALGSFLGAGMRAQRSRDEALRELDGVLRWMASRRREPRFN